MTTQGLDPDQPTPTTPERLDHWEIDQESLRSLMEGLGNGGPSEEWFRLRRDFEAVALNPGVDRLITLDCTTIKELPHQIDVALRVLRRPMGGRAILADEVGLGKTIEAGIIMKELGVRGLAPRVLVLAPASLVSQWQAELETKFFEHFATPGEPEDWHHAGKAIVSFQQAIGERHAREILAHRWDLVIVDEAHKVQNHDTAVYRFLQQIDHNYLLLLTARPLQHNLRELYNLITLLRPGQLGTWGEFRREHVAPGDPRRASNPEALRELTKQVMVRTRRSSVADALNLPPRSAAQPLVELSPDEAALYRETARLLRDVYRDGLFQPSGKGLFVLELMRVLQRLTSSAKALADSLHSLAAGELVQPDYRLRARHLAEQAREVGRHAKLDMLTSYLADTPDRVIVFSEHLPTLNLLSHRVQAIGRPAICFTGSLSQAERSRQLARFKRDPGSVFLTTRVGSEGLNLQFCNRVVNYELPWNPTIIEQRIGRVHRIGQEREVHILNLAAQATIEMSILRLLYQKIEQLQLVAGELDIILDEFGGAEMLERRLTDAWLRAESDAGFEHELEAVGERIVVGREAAVEQERLASEIAAEDNAARLEREFRQLSVPGRVTLGYGTCHLKLARGVEAKRQQLGLHVTEIREAAERAGHVEDGGVHPDFGRLYRIAGVTWSGRAVELRVQADRLPMTLVDLNADAAAPGPGDSMIDGSGSAPAEHAFDPAAAEALVDPRLRGLVERYATLVGATVQELEPQLVELSLPGTEIAHFGGHGSIRVAYSLAALERHSGAKLAVVGSALFQELLDAIRSRGYRRPCGLIPHSHSAGAPSVALTVPVRNGSADSPIVSVAVHPAARLVARVAIKAAAIVEEHIAASGVFDLATGARAPEDLADLCLDVEWGRVPPGGADAAAGFSPLPARPLAELVPLMLRDIEGRVAAELARHGHEVRGTVHPLQLVEFEVLVQRADWALANRSGRLASLTAERMLSGSGAWELACPNCRLPPAELLVCRHDHLACAACGKTCAVCGEEFCGAHGIAECHVDRQPACDAHAKTCPACGRAHCTAHEGTCADGDHSACTACLGTCAACGKVVCSTHAAQSDAGAPKGGRRLCRACVVYCQGGTNEPVGRDEAVRCASCDGFVCAHHHGVCAVDGQLHCNTHLAPLHDTLGHWGCESHRTVCHVDQLTYSVAGTKVCPLCERPTCAVHLRHCDWCGRAICQTDMERHASCFTCRRLADGSLTSDALVAAAVRANLDGPTVKACRSARDATHTVVELDLGWSRRLVFAVRHGDGVAETVVCHAAFGRTTVP